MIVLDTHIWLWWVNQDSKNLKPDWMSRIQSPEDVGVSAISCFEVAWLERHNRIILPCSRQEWFEKALIGSGITLLPVSPAIASLAVDLYEHHSDPQDRIIIATALAYKSTLISADGKFPLYTELTGLLLS
ncbi:PilT-like protein [Crenothrix polyspora]|uniref:PilT-like protein n=1 Tax=Crenothrix polyspora TaxID=360316 RepID=A0A1R4HH54_9GAMM|nr:type II toxin-antitoxin system VapC family toxin [Crenothrix polyspora]SJM95553.1 PilT-like protein [Crenothrix polyspora]